MRAAWRGGLAWPCRDPLASSSPAIGLARRACWPTPPPPAPRKRLGAYGSTCRQRRYRRIRKGVSRMSPADTVFEEHRPALTRLAYRMLGSMADADDVVQEAYLRWTREDRTAVT